MILKDNGANIVKGLNLKDIPHLSCFAHSLQLVVEDGFKTQPAVVDVIANVCKIANISIIQFLQNKDSLSFRLDWTFYTIQYCNQCQLARIPFMHA